MINFNDEIRKFKPMLELANIEKSTKEDDVADIIGLLQYIASNVEHNKGNDEKSGKG